LREARVSGGAGSIGVVRPPPLGVDRRLQHWDQAFPRNGPIIDQWRQHVVGLEFVVR
jgi:hypothetical protein